MSGQRSNAGFTLVTSNVDLSTDDSLKKKPNCLQKAASAISSTLELFYYNLGVAVAKRPKTTIAAVMAACLLCLFGLFNFSDLKITDPVWIDQNSEYITHLNWLDREFPALTRNNICLMEGDNLLTREALIEMHNIHREVMDIRGDDYTYESLCTRYGIGDNSQCWSTSILELWGFNIDIIKSLTVEDILKAVNITTRSPVTNTEVKPSDYLGGLTVNGSGYITQAKAALAVYFLQETNSTQLEDKVLSWELNFISFIRTYAPQNSIKSFYVFAERSLPDEFANTYDQDILLLMGGYGIMAVFVSMVMSNFNCVEMRVYMAVGCIVGVGLSMAASVGVCSACGVPYSPVVSALPFLLLGLGVDDGLVIVQSWAQLSTKRPLSVAEQAGSALKHAGVAITVTSITDILAFGIGATTVLPGLRHFCIYGAVAILAVFIVQATMFTAICVLDVQRRDSLCNGLLCCYKHEPDYEPKPCSRRNLQQMFFEKVYGPFLTRLPVKLIVIVLSLGLLAIGIYSVLLLEQHFDRKNFLFRDSYAKRYVDVADEYFPQHATYRGHVYFVKRNMYEEHSKIESLMDEFRLQVSVDGDTVDFWYEDYIEWLNTTSCPWIRSHLNDNSWPHTAAKFDMLIVPFLFLSDSGRRHLKDIKFYEDIEFPATFNHTSMVLSSGYPFGLNLSTTHVLGVEKLFQTMRVKVARAPFEFTHLGKSPNKVRAMDSIRFLLKEYYSITEVFVHSASFEDWETDKIIKEELYRNLGIAFVCVVILTLFLIADIAMCALVSICVLASVIEIGGMMYFWGLYIDTVTCILLVSGVGLTVDYAAHVGHTFMTVQGTRNERTVKTMTVIGCAVFNGGFSTQLALLMLNLSSSFIFNQFLRVGMLIVCFGLWNGLVFLPVLLSLIGPPAYFHKGNETSQEVSSPEEKDELSDSVTNDALSAVVQLPSGYALVEPEGKRLVYHLPTETTL